MDKNLTKKEQDLVQQLLGPTNKVIFAGIGELLLSNNSTKEAWFSVVRPGVVCLIHDSDKNAIFLSVINMSKGEVAWKQNIDNNVKSQRRRRWIFVFELGIRRLMLNFVDDEEADDFSYILYNTFPRLKSFEGTLAYTVSDHGAVLRNYPKSSKSRKVSREEKLKKILIVAGLSETVLEDPDKREEIDNFCKVYEEEMDALDEVYDDDEYIIEEDDDEEDDTEEEEEGDILESEYADDPLNDENELESLVEGQDNGQDDGLDFSSMFNMGEYSLEDPDEIMLSAPPKYSPSGKDSGKASVGNTSRSRKLPIASPPPPPPAPGKNPDERKMSLLDEIKHPPFALKKVTPSKGVNKRKKPSKNDGDTLEDQLLIAMQRMRNAKSNLDDGAANEQMSYRDWDDD
jgi:hypothetical protein